jgi:hypothetical protein
MCRLNTVLDLWDVMLGMCSETKIGSFNTLYMLHCITAFPKGREGILTPALMPELQTHMWFWNIDQDHGELLPSPASLILVKQIFLVFLAEDCVRPTSILLSKRLAFPQILP